MKFFSIKTLFFAACTCCLFSINAQEKGKIPIEKGLSQEWINSLYERGEVTTYLKSRNELQYIGMPVGGINAGGVYLGGDGRLWLWDIFNETKEGIEPKLVPWNRYAETKKVETDANAVQWSNQLIRSRDGACYVEPAKNVRPLQQGFILKFEYNGKTICKTLEAEYWDEIAFEAGYPIGTVRYSDKTLPVELVLKAYSPFIPLNEDESGLPATILSFSVKNTSSANVKVSFLGYLENKTSIRSAVNINCRRKNEVVKTGGIVAVTEMLEVLREKPFKELSEKPDYGTMCIAAINNKAKAYPDIYPSATNASFDNKEIEKLSKPVLEPLVGAVQTDLSILPNTSQEANFVISWYFPNLKLNDKIEDSGRYYQNTFSSALEVAKYIGKNYERLSSSTELWAATWKESTLPHWFLERTFLTVNTLATNNCYRLSSGRFWAWEGVGTCDGTCTHVWQYAQAMGRLFPALERDCRERSEFGIAMQPDGGIFFRAEMSNRPAIDGQAGCVLRCYREHQMSADDAFLKRNWPNIKRAIEFILKQDKNKDGMEDTPMENTLDAIWDGEIAWIVGLCISSVKAGEEMAKEVGDVEFAKICANYVQQGSKNMDKYLFNGEYYIHRPDKEKGRAKLGSYNTCHIDQVYGQSWAYQVGLGRIQDQKKTLSALNALWKYNYTPDVGPYIEVNKGGRPYALPGEGGMVMNTNPKNEPRPYGDNVSWQLGYFHECMSGFEYQVAAHMIAEGLTDKGLVLVRSIHDRYNGAKRNPYNEIECSDHYARAMASYGAFITACGFEYHGPKGYMKFAPKWDQANFKAPFTAAEGWGTYTQQQTGEKMSCSIQPKYGKLQLKTFGVEAPKGKNYKSVNVNLNGTKIQASVKQNGRNVLILFDNRVIIPTGQLLEITLI